MINRYKSEKRTGGIRMERREGLSCPIVFCSWCGEEIEDAGDGNYEWLEADEGESAEIFFTHKKCCHPFEYFNGGKGSEDRYHWCAGELRVFPHYLAINLELPVNIELIENRSTIKCTMVTNLANM